MSRTYRRKNYEETQGTSWDRKGRKTAGYYTEWYYSSYDQDGRWYQHTSVYREPTKEEYRRKWMWTHGDCKRWNTPPFWFRKNYQRMVNTFNDRQLKMWYDSLGEYDPVFIPVFECTRDWT